MKLFQSAAAGIFAGALCGSAHAVDFDITWQAGTTDDYRNGFLAATQFWSSVLHDNFTVKLQLGSVDGDIDNNSAIIGATASTQESVSYSTVYAAYAADAKSAADATAVAHMATPGSTKVLVNRVADNPNNNEASPLTALPFVVGSSNPLANSIIMNTAQMKAVGLVPLASDTSDGSIEYSNNYASQFDFDRADGIGAGKIDFVGTAIHEIGHALGFTSFVDVLDYCGTVGQDCGPPGAPYPSSEYARTVLDLFRYSAQSVADGATDFTADRRTKYFSIDGGETSLASFATGQSHGDGTQASHWKYNRYDDQKLGIMDPIAPTGTYMNFTALDLEAFDVLGYDVTAVPEPSTYALMFGGLLAIGAFSRRRNAQRRG